MAHECPECGLTCYCGGDIDDLLLSGTDEEIRCQHYLRQECDGWEGEEEYFDDDEEDLDEGEGETR